MTGGNEQLRPFLPRDQVPRLLDSREQPAAQIKSHALHIGAGATPQSLGQPHALVFMSGTPVRQYSYMPEFLFHGLPSGVVATGIPIWRQTAMTLPGPSGA